VTMAALCGLLTAVSQCATCELGLLMERPRLASSSRYSKTRSSMMIAGMPSADAICARTSIS